MSSIAGVISWKFNNQPGMRCKEVDGILTIIEFPGGIPSQSDQDTWTQEYNAYATEAKRIQDIKDIAQSHIIALLPSGDPLNFVIKELNLMMLNAELDDIVIKGGILDVTQQAQKTAFITLKDNIKTIRAMSKAARAGTDAPAKFEADLVVVKL